MIQKRILVVNPSSAEADRLTRLAQKYGSALSETDPEAAMAVFAEGDFAVVVFDVAFAGSTGPPSHDPSPDRCAPDRRRRGLHR